MMAQSFEDGGIYYYVTDATNKTVEVTSNPEFYTGDIVIPATASDGSNTYAVTSIGINAFSECTSLTNVTIPSSVTSIEYQSFVGCTSLTSVTIPSSVTSIGTIAFYGCTSLTSITIPSSVTSIGNYAFWDCSSLKTVAFLGEVTSIGNEIFYNCSVLESIYVPDDYRFDYEDYYLADYASKIVGSTFTFTEGEITYRITNQGEVEVTYNGNIIFDENHYTGDIVIPATASDGSSTYAVTNIGDNAFYGCSGLTSVTIPSSVTSIEYQSFNGCTSLTSVAIPSSVTSIGDNAFLDNKNLTSITIPSSVTSIGEGTFAYCIGLKSVAILGDATNIGYGAFWDCTALKTIYVPYESVETYQANENLAEHSEKIKGSIDVELKAASIGGAYASVYLPFPATLVEGDAKAYVGENLEAGTLTLARATEIAANEGFILYADAPCTATLRVGATEEAATSIIEGTNTDIALTDDNRADYLVFGISNGEIGFFKPAASIGSIPANRAFLPNTGGVSAVRMFFNDGETTDIEVIENGQLTMENAPVYDLSGRRVTSPAKGSLYIRNGQKFIWK